MLLYPEMPGRRALTVALDLVVLLVLVGSVVLSSWAHDGVMALADPAISVQRTAEDVAAELSRPLDIPLVGNALRSPLDAMARGSQQVGDAAEAQVHAVARAAGVARAITLLPGLVIGGLRARNRIRWTVDARTASAARSTPGGPAVLALRAAVSAPLPQVLRVLRGRTWPVDDAQLAALAGLELGRLGLRPPEMAEPRDG